ncbi:integral membrane protein [Diaporthe helianthi]|uniref:Integral membrane protein n=1 Tax=Diaporthe helianthi TaxID=158607 RepID=A0A2P5HNS8_DIAHE|nr:integral membrane protein [Diaporthe helianthi]
MNAASVYRASLYGLDQPLGMPPVNWVQYKHECAQEATTKPESIFDVEWEQEPEVTTVTEQALRLITIFPYRDAVWVVKIFLTLGGTLMAFAATFTVETVQRQARGQNVSPQTVGFDINAAIMVTTHLGLTLLLISGTLGLIAILNAHRGAMEPLDIKIGALEPPKAYKPALLGAKSWVWLPTRADLTALWAKVPFRAAFINWVGLIVLNIVNFTTIPGLIDPADTQRILLADQLPLFIGFVLLVVANFTLAMWLQERWYKPKWQKAAWVSSFLATVAAVSLTLSTLYQFAGLVLSGALATVVGRWVFFVAILIGFYDLMAFHPNAWAGIAIGGR